MERLQHHFIILLLYFNSSAVEMCEFKAVHAATSGKKLVCSFVTN